MSLNSLLDDPPLDALRIIRYLKGQNIHITAKNVVFLQIEYKFKNETIPPTTTLKDLCRTLWNSATPHQRRRFEMIAQNVNLMGKRFKRRYFYRHRHHVIENANDLITGLNFF